MKRLLQARDSQAPPRLILLDAAAFLTILVVTLVWQWASGAHSSAFGAEADEASHYVTGVMVRDYIGRGLPGNPVTFAKDFYLHYPRVAFGIWPPLFHLFSGVWMLAFGTGRISVLLLLAALTAIWAYIFYWFARRVLGRPAAMISALLLVSLPTIQMCTSAVMLDIPLAVMMLLAMGAYARYLERERTADAFMFGLYASMALLVKYNALALALLPPLCVVITGRHYLWRSKAFWLPAAVVLLVAGPWYVGMHHLVLYAAEPGGTAPIGPAIADSAKGIILVAGPVVFVLALIGSVLVSLNMRKRLQLINYKDWSPFVVAVAMVLAVFIFHAIYPLYESRYSLPAAPALILLAWPSLAYMHSRLRIRPTLKIAAFFFFAAVHAASTFVIPPKRTTSYVRVADAVLACGLPLNGAVLVSAEAIGEGMLTAEFVMRDHRPDHYVVRASKVLGTQTLMGDNYQLKYRNPEEIMTTLDSIPIAVVVIQQCPKGKCGEHENILNQAAARYPERWRLSSVIPDETGSPIRIYQITGNEGKVLRTLHIDMSPTLGTTIEQQ
jgi:hypothetical protein